MKFTWVAKQLNVIPSKEQHKDVVYSIVWEINAVDGEDFASNFGAVLVNTDNLENFTAYENLTEKQVLSWIFAALGQEGKMKIESEAQAVIEAKKLLVTIVSKASLPWAIVAQPE